MKLNVEVSGLQIGINNSITEAMKTGNWGTRISFTEPGNTSRYEVILNQDEVRELAEKLINAIAQAKNLPAIKPVDHIQIQFTVEK